MNCVENVIEQIVSGFQNDPNLSGCRVISGFPSEIKDVPLRKTTIAVSVDSLSLNEGAAGRYFGIDSFGGEVFGRIGRFGIKLSIAVPKALGGDECNSTLSAICAAAVDGSPAGRIISLTAGEISFNRSLGALVLPVKMTVDAVIGDESQSGGEYYSNIVLKAQTEAMK